MQLPKHFDSTDLLYNFDDFLTDFWRNCVRLNIESDMVIKYAIFDHLDSVSKTLCTDFSPEECKTKSVFHYFAGLRSHLLPLNDLSSAKLAYTNFVQNDLALDLFFEKKYSLFKRCNRDQIRKSDYQDFIQRVCDSLTNKRLAFEVRKLSLDLACTNPQEVNNFRTKLINLGETLFQSIACSQMEDLHKNTLITQSMLNTLSDSKVTVPETVAQADSYEERNQEYEDDLDYNSYDLHGQIIFSPEELMECIAAAQNDNRSCYYCMKVGHIKPDCPDLKALKAPHPNSMYYPSNNKPYSNNRFPQNGTTQGHTQGYVRGSTNDYSANRINNYQNSYNPKRSVTSPRRPFQANRGGGRGYTTYRGYRRGSMSYSPSYNENYNSGGGLKNPVVAQVKDQVGSMASEQSGPVQNEETRPLIDW